MKKIIAILFISFLSLQTTFASLTLAQETKIKTQVEKAYLSFEKKLSKIETEAQIKKINTVTGKINLLLKKKLSDKNRLVLTHLNDLLKERKVVLEGNDIDTIEVKKDETPIVENPKQEQNTSTVDGNKYKEIPNLLYSMKAEDIVNKYYLDYLKDTYGNGETFKFYYKNAIDIINISQSLNKNTIIPFKAQGEKDIPFKISSITRDPAYDIDISKSEQELINKYEYESLNLKAEITNLMKKGLLLSGKEAQLIMNDANKLKSKYNNIVFNYLSLIRKKWELKNICIAKASNGLMLKDRTTMKQIGFKTEKELYELTNEYRFSAYYGSPMLCDYYLLYPELKVTISELEKMSKSELENLLNSDSYIPTIENSKNMGVFIWDTNIKTSFDQAKWIHKWAKQAKIINIQPYINKKNGLSGDSIFSNIKLIENDFYYDINQ